MFSYIGKTSDWMKYKIFYVRWRYDLSFLKRREDLLNVCWCTAKAESVQNSLSAHAHLWKQSSKRELICLSLSFNSATLNNAVHQNWNLENENVTKVWFVTLAAQFTRCRIFLAIIAICLRSFFYFLFEWASWRLHSSSFVEAFTHTCSVSKIHTKR